MSDELRLQVSAFLDQELPETESELFVRRLCVDDALRGTLGRYALIGDAIREDSVTVPAAFASGVAARLEGEADPEVVADRAATAAATGPGRWFRPLAAASITLAVAAAAVLSLNTSKVAEQTPVLTAGTTPGDTRPASLTTVPEPADIYPLTLTGESYTVPAAVPVSRRSPDDRAKLRRYLVTHSAHAGSGPQGVLPYRVIGLESEQGRAAEESATR